MTSKTCHLYTEGNFCRRAGPYLLIHGDGQVIQMADASIFSYFMNNKVGVSDEKKTQTLTALTFLFPVNFREKFSNSKPYYCAKQEIL